MKNETLEIAEIIDQARILLGTDDTKEIAEHLTNSGTKVFPCNVGETVYFLIPMGRYGTILTTGTPIPRTVNKITWDGESWEIASNRTNESFDGCNIYGKWGETVFATKTQAEQYLSELRRKSADGRARNEQV